MSGKHYPWWPMYAADWLSDPRLFRCSLAAEGLLIRVLNVAYQCPQRGKLADESGVWNEAEIVAATGNRAGAAKCLDELLRFGVLRKEPESGAIYSKRMLDDCRARDATATRVGRHRNAHCNAHCNAIVRGDSEPYHTSISTEEMVKTINTPEAGMAKAGGISGRDMDGWMPGEDGWAGKDVRSILASLGIRGPNLDALAASGLTVEQIKAEAASVASDASTRKPAAVLARRLLTAAGVPPKKQVPRESVAFLARMEALRRNRGVAS